MRKPVSLLLCALIGAVFSLGAAAHGPGGGGGFGGGFSHGSAVGPSSSGALENSNGRFSQDRDQGMDRAQDRMSDQGLTNEQATQPHKKRHYHARGSKSTSDTGSAKH